MPRSVNKTQSKLCINKHGASKIIDTFETYQAMSLQGDVDWRDELGGEIGEAEMFWFFGNSSQGMADGGLCRGRLCRPRTREVKQDYQGDAQDENKKISIGVEALRGVCSQEMSSAVIGVCEISSSSVGILAARQGGNEERRERRSGQIL
jgi:hypothetical protein